MSREGWIYALAFVVLVGAGAFLIVPRLGRQGATATVPAPPAPPPEALPVEPRAPVEAPVPTWVEIRLTGPQGVLYGPPKAVVGAEQDVAEGTDASAERLRIRATEDVVHVGAAGHRWVAIEARSLEDGMRVVLPRAAPPVIVRVREPDGRPAPDVPLLVLPRSPGPMPRTDAGGTVVIDDAEAGALLLVGVGGREREGGDLRVVAGPDGADVKVTLEPAWRVLGRALDGDGRPLREILIEGRDALGPLGAPVRSDAAGRFVWRGPVVPTLALRFTAPGVAARRIEVRPPARGALATEVGDVVVDVPVVSLQGRVLAPSGAAGTRVTVEPAVAAPLREVFGPGSVLFAGASAEIGPDGSFLLRDVPAGHPLRVAVRGAGLPVDDLVDPADASSDGVLSLSTYTPPPGHVLRGTLRDEVLGRPAAGVRLLVSTRPMDGRQTGPGDYVVVTDGAGRFRVDGLPRGSVFVRAYEPERKTLRAEVALPRPSPVPLSLERRVEDDAHLVWGMVVDDMKHPLAGVQVEAAGRDAVTGADGVFRLEGVEGVGEDVLVVARYAPGQVVPTGVRPTAYVAGVRRRVRPGPDPVQLVLPRGATLVFRALDGMDDEALSFVHVLWKTDDGQVLVDRAVATRDGHVRLEGLLPGGGLLTVLSTAHRVTLPVILEPGEVVDRGAVRLAHGMHVKGRVVDVDGRGVGGALLGGVETGWVAGRGVDPTAARELDLRVTQADSDGRFVIEGFDPKRPAVIAVWAPGYAPAARRLVLEQFKDDVSMDVTVRLLQGGWLDVELVDEGTGRPIAGAFLDLEDARNGSDFLDLLRRGMLSGPVGSDEDWRRASVHFLLEKREGRYRLGPIEPGPYDVWADRPGYQQLHRRLTILDPADAIVSITEGETRSLTDSPYLTWELVPGR